MTDWLGTTTYSYNALHQLTSVTYVGSKTFSYTYDAAGNRATFTDSDSGQTTYSYTDRGQLYQLTNPDSQVTTFTYDDGGRRTRQTLANSAYTDYTYNNRNWLTAISNKKSDASVIFSASYSYDFAGSRTRMTEGNGDYADYGYDDIYQLVSEVKKNSGGSTLYSRSFEYDAVGNRTRLVKDGTSTYYCYDDNNKLVRYRVGGSDCDTGGSLYSFTYDNNGNTATITRPDSTVETFTWDYENRLTQYQYPGQTVVGSYVYDGAGHRVQKTEGGVTTKYLYDGDRVQAEYDASWNLQAKYTIEGDSYYSPLISMKRGGATYWHVYDGLGSTRRLINSSQTVTDSYSYEAFGDITSSSGSTVNPYRYVGALGYSYSGAMPNLHVGARWLSTGLGRFVSEDPERAGWPRPGGQSHPPLADVPGTQQMVSSTNVQLLNLYLYVDNRPTVLVDPSGRFWPRMPCSLCGAMSAVVCGALCSRCRFIPRLFTGCMAFCMGAMAVFCIDVLDCR